MKFDPEEHISYNTNAERDTTDAAELTQTSQIDQEEDKSYNSNSNKTPVESIEVKTEDAKPKQEEHISYNSTEDRAVTDLTEAAIGAKNLDPQELGNIDVCAAKEVSTEDTKLNPREHNSYNTNDNKALTDTTEVTMEAGNLGREEKNSHSANVNRSAAQGTDTTDSPQNSSVKKYSSKNALAMVMDFSILSNSTVMLIDVIQQWQLTTDPLLTVLLILLPFVMFLQLPVAILVMLAIHGNYHENTRRHIQNSILALLSLSTALMLVSDLLKVKTDSVQVVVAPSTGRKE